MARVVRAGGAGAGRHESGPGDGVLDAADGPTAGDARGGRAGPERRAAAGGRTEVVLYYSGHADEQGLLIGADRYSYRTLRDRLDQIPADVRIASESARFNNLVVALKITVLLVFIATGGNWWQSREVRAALSNSAGFGGHNVSLILKRG